MSRKEDQWNRQGEHEITGDGSHKISAFKLPHTDQDTERRNFPGYQTHTPGEALMNAISNEGHTETRGGKDMHDVIKISPYELPRKFK